MSVWVWGPLYTEDRKLVEIHQAYWPNTILFKLADALGYVPGHRTSAAIDPDQILNEALEIIWMYRELGK